MADCPTCSGPTSRQTVDMVCQSCGRDFLSRTALDWQAIAKASYAEGWDQGHEAALGHEMPKPRP